MSLIISVYVAEGIVMASDSRMTFTTSRQIKSESDGGKDLEIHEVAAHITDSSYKTFVTESHVGISTCGNATISGHPLAGYVEEFIQKNQTKNVDDIANTIGQFFHNIDKNFDSTLLVCGYLETEDGNFEQRIYNINTQTGELKRQNDQGVFGANWAGVIDYLSKEINPVAKIINGSDGKKYEDCDPVEILWNQMTLQDAIDFARYAIQMTIDTMRFINTAKTVGGPIDILVLKPNSHQWIDRKEFH